MKHYTVHATRSGRWWSITIDEDPRAQTQTRRLDQVEAAAKAVLLDTGAISATDTPTFTITPHLGELDELRTAALTAKANAQHAADLASSSARVFVATASDLGLPYRDIGAMLEITHQRAQQLAASR